MLQLEQQYLRANLAQARLLLAGAQDDDDPIGQHQYTQLVRELADKLDALPRAIEHAPASVALFFGGRPVVGSQGIHAEFSSKALDGFQKIVSQRFAAEELGPLASKGRVPLKDNTHLLITDVVRGSFGFVLQGAAQDSGEVASSESGSSRRSLKAVVDKVASTISRVAAQDDALFDEAVAEIDERQKSSLSEFFKLLDTEGATMRLVEGERDFELDLASVQRARRRVEQLVINDSTEEVSGEIVGWADFSARFELRRHDHREVVLSGSVARAALERVEQEGLEPYHKHFCVALKVRKVASRNRSVKTVYTLTDLKPISAPADWKAAPLPSVLS